MINRPPDTAPTPASEERSPEVAGELRQEASRGIQQLLACAQPPDVLRSSRARWSQEVQALLCEHFPKKSLRRLASIATDLGLDLDVPGFLAMGVMHAHFDAGSVVEVDLSELCDNFPSTVPFNVIEQLGCLIAESSAHPQREEFLRALGHIFALDATLTGGTLLPAVLPFYQERTIRGGAPYVDLATGPSIRWHCEYLASLHQPLRMPVFFNDVSPFIEGEFEEMQTHFGFDPSVIRFLRGDATAVTREFPEEGIGVLRLDNIGLYLHSTEMEWYVDIASRIINGGRIILNAKVSEMDTMFENVRSSRGVSDVIRAISSVDALDARLTGCLMRKFQNVLRSKEVPSRWELTMGTIRDDGTFALGVIEVRRRSCVTQVHPTIVCTRVQ